MQHVTRCRQDLAALVQGKSGVRQYTSSFRRLISELGAHAPDSASLLFNYVQGLNPVLRYKLTKHEPHSFAEAEERAVAVESAERVMRAPLPRLDSGARGPPQQQQQ